MASSVGTVRRVVLCQLFADDLVFHALSSKRGSAPSSRTPHRLSRLNEAEALHRQDVAYCGEMGCVIALQEHTPQCQILPLSRSGAQDVLRLLAEWRALLRGYCTSRSGKSSETLQPEQLVDLEFSVVLPQAPKVLPLPGFRLLLSRILLMCLTTLQLVVSKGPGQRRNADRGSLFFFFRDVARGEFSVARSGSSRMFWAASCSALVSAFVASCRHSSTLARLMF